MSHGTASGTLWIALTPKAAATTTQTIISVTTSSTSVLSANANRLAGWVRNISDTTIYVSLSGTASASAPSKLSPGESLQFGNGTWCYTGAVAAIHAGSGNKSLEVVEV